VPSGERLLTIAARLQARAQPALPPGLVPLRIAGQRVGLAQPIVAHFLAGTEGFRLQHRELVMVDFGLDADGRTERLAQAARALRDAQLLTGWRDEPLSVRAAPGGPVLAAIERSACRPLGIATTAVHLNAYADDGDVVVARRAAHKQIDPGCWDNLVGGMVPHGETLEQALEREAWEEAGIELDRIEVHRGRTFTLLRAVPEGVQHETIHVYDATLAATTEPRNQDGEVDAIETRTVADVLDAIERDTFTLESALVMIESLTRRAGVAVTSGLYLYA
jgi:8-oxo-dGTP pyrophosphatase MutT (NUDIX family)